MATKKTPRKVTRSRLSKKPSFPLILARALPKYNFSVRSFVPVVTAVIVGVLLFSLAKQYRGLVLAAVVNKTPITTFELNSILVKRYGQSTLDEIINEKLLVDLATQNQITISQADLDAEVKKLEDNLGGKDKLAAAMTQYGLDDKALQQQIRVRLLQQKLAEKLFPTTVTDEEVKKYFDDNKLVYKDKKFDDVKTQIKQDLTDQKLQDQFMKWFQEQKQKAAIHIYLNQ